MARRPLQEINAGSMADIAFLLLIFFLVTTTMETNKGLPRMLPKINNEPIPPEQEIKARNVFTVLINSNNQLLVEGKPGSIDKLCEQVKEFIENKNGSATLSERTKDPKNIEFFGMVNYVSKGVVSLQNDRGTKYKIYIEVQNELVRAFSELRDAKAKSKFGKTFKELEKEKDDLSQRQVKAVRKIYPLAISEAEPRAIGE